MKQVLSGPVHGSNPLCLVIYSMHLIAPVSDVSDNAHTTYDFHSNFLPNPLIISTIYITLA